MDDYSNKSKDWLAGYSAYSQYYESQGYSSFTRNIRPEDAAKLFLPAVEESHMQVSTPLPRARREWVEGWQTAKADDLPDQSSSHSAPENNVQ